MSALLFDERFKQLTLAAVDGLPPRERLGDCRTQDQRMHWDSCRRGYRLLREELEAYFQGRGSQIPFLPSPERRYWGAMRSRYLDWYAVAQYGWAYIEAGFFENGTKVSEYSSASSGVAADSPVGALAKVLEDECFLFLDQAFRPYYQFAPSKYRKMNQRQKRIDSGKAKPHEIKRHETEIKQEFLSAVPYLAFSQKCIDLCESQASNDEELSRLIQRYYEASERVCKAIDSAIHPSKKMVGCEWQHGIRSEMSSRGGVPSQAIVT